MMKAFAPTNADGSNVCKVYGRDRYVIRGRGVTGCVRIGLDVQNGGVARRSTDRVHGRWIGGGGGGGEEIRAL